MRTPRTSSSRAAAGAALLVVLLPGATIAQGPGKTVPTAPPAAPSEAPVASAAPGASADPGAAPTVTGTWFDGLVTGACYELTLDGANNVDFSVPPTIVDCAAPHANEVAGTVHLGDGDTPPANVDQLTVDGCTDVFAAFLGRPIDGLSNLLFPFPVWPDETDWAAGVRDAVCSVVGNGLIGSVASGSLTAPGETLAVFYQGEADADIWLLDAGTGEPIRAVTGDETTELLGPPAWAADGTSLLFAAQFADDDTDVFRAAADGSGVEPVIVGPGRQEGADEAPDGSTIAYIDNRAGGEYDIWLAPADGSAEGAAITDHPERDATPQWSPDGTQILFRRVTDGLSEIWLMGADGSDPRRLIENGVDTYDPRWAPDGASILFTTDAGGTLDIWTAAADGTGARQLTTHPGSEEYPTYSRDGRVIAFMTDRMGVPTTWLMNADGTDASLLSPIAPAGYPAFAPVEVAEGAAK